MKLRPPSRRFWFLLLESLVIVMLWLFICLGLWSVLSHRDR